MKKNYLPSKKFIIVFFSISLLLGVILIISNRHNNKNAVAGENAKKNEIQAIKGQSLTINDLMKKDTDGDSVYDWEEALWGLDSNNKNTNEGITDADFLKNKRSEIQAENGTELDDSANLNATEQFSREFLTTLSALQQSGQADVQTIENISSSLAQKIKNPLVLDTYDNSSFKIAEADTMPSQKQYYSKVQKLFQGYLKDNLGDELGIVSQIISTDDEDRKKDLMQSLDIIGGDYQDFAEKLTAIPVPQSLSLYALLIANAANNTGVSVKNMSNLSEDPIVGLSGLAQYEKYSADLISAADNLKTYLLINGIIFE